MSRPGDVVMVRCDVVMANDVSGPIAFRAMEKMGVQRVFDPSRVVMVADHFAPAKDARSAELQRRLKEWSEAQGVTFYDQGRGGIEHALLCEEGWILPGAVIAGGDSHTCTLRRARRVRHRSRLDRHRVCLAFGEFWQAVPSTIRVEFTGERAPFVTGKDLILAVIAQIGVGGGTNAALEFVGAGARALSIDERLAVSNMAVEAGAETGSSRPTTRWPTTSMAVRAASGDCPGDRTPTRRSLRRRSRSTWQGSSLWSRSRTCRAMSSRLRKQSERESTRPTSATARTGR